MQEGQNGKRRQWFLLQPSWKNTKEEELQTPSLYKHCKFSGFVLWYVLKPSRGHLQKRNCGLSEFAWSNVRPKRKMAQYFRCSIKSLKNVHGNLPEESDGHLKRFKTWQRDHLLGSWKYNFWQKIGHDAVELMTTNPNKEKRRNHW